MLDRLKPLNLPKKLFGHYQTVDIPPRGLKRFSPDPGNVVIGAIWDTSVMIYPNMAWEDRVILVRMVDHVVGRESNICLSTKPATTKQQIGRIVDTFVDFELRFPDFYEPGMEVAHA